MSAPKTKLSSPKRLRAKRVIVIITIAFAVKFDEVEGLEGYPSGSRGGFAKPVDVRKCVRGFESLFLRLKVKIKK